MKVSTEKLENRQVLLNIEVEEEEMEESLVKAYHRLRKKVSIPGFRKGKAPRFMLENYIGKEGLKEEALEDLIPQVCNKAIEEQGLEVIAKPDVEILQLSPVILKTTVSLRPVVELGEYRQIKLSPEKVNVTDEQINTVLEQLRDRSAIWNPIEKSVSFGDMVTIDIEGGEEGTEAMGSYQGQQYPVIQGSLYPLPGFSEQITGMTKGEEKEFTLSFASDHEIKELSGKNFKFKVRLTEIKQKQLPELNDEFAKGLGGGSDTLAALRDSIASNLKNIAEEKSRRDFEQKLVEMAAESAKVEFPPVLVEQEIDRLLHEREEMLKNQGGLEKYLKSLNKTKEQMRDDIRPNATKGVIESLVVGKIAEVEKIEIDVPTIEAEIENILKTTGQNTEEMRKLFNTFQGRRWIEERLISQKTLKCLSDIAAGNDNKDSSIGSTSAEVADAGTA